MTAGEQVWRLGVDVGGTFTDIALLNESTGASAVHKTPTRADDLVGSVIQGIAEVLDETGVRSARCRLRRRWVNDRA